jgi:dUTP pyrophosphatase
VEGKNTMKLKIQLQHPNAKAPTYGTEGAACFDLHAATAEALPTTWFISPGDQMVIGTGLAFEIPDGYMLQIRSRSGLAFNHRIEAFHGTIDSDYRGEVKVMLKNIGRFPVRINTGDRIAQACLVPVPRVDFEVVEQLTLTERGAGGFGSTGQA